MTTIVSTEVEAPAGHELRFRIDEIDDQIGQLLKERRMVSHQLQKQRVRSGGARVDLSRENEVILGYTTRLGPDGRDVADHVLQFCRGNVNAASDESEG